MSYITNTDIMLLRETIYYRHRQWL